MYRLRNWILFGSLLFIMACQADDDNGLGGLDVTDINDIDDPTIDGNTPQDVQTFREELGRLLFWDPILSGEKDISCATCHHPDFGYADGRALPIGVGGEGLGPQRRDVSNDGIGLVIRNSPTILNTAFNGVNNNGNVNPNNAPMFWDNRTFGLENQALQPLLSFEEMRGHAFSENVALDSIVARLEANAQYQALFAQAFGNQNAITDTNIGRAIAAFERTITATNSPFDQFQAGNQNAMTQQQIRGMDRFRRIGCDECHSGPMFSDFELHVLGVPDHPALTESDAGANGTYAFRTPTLRNLRETAPYFHNGVAEDLEETLQFYITARNAANNNGGGPGGGGNGNNGPGDLEINPNVNPNQLDDEIDDLNNFNNDDIEDIIAFLEALNDPDFDRSIPNSVPSGLPVGGNID